MTFSLKITDATFTKYIAQVPPYLSSAKMMLLFGTDGTSSTNNYVTGVGNATVTGTPTYGTGFATFSPTAYIEAPMAARNIPFTYLGIVSSPTLGQSLFGSSITNIYMQSLGPNLFSDGGTRGGTAALPSGYSFVALTYEGSSAKIYIGNSGTVTAYTISYTGGVSGTGKFRVGGLVGSGTTFNAAATMVFESVLTAGQIADLYNYYRLTLPIRGITVL